MTEAEWLATNDPKGMLALLKGKASDRKLRLLTVAACERIRHLLPKRSLDAVTALERYADGLIADAEYQAAWSEADVEARMCVQDPPNAMTYAAESVMISSPPTTASVEYALSTASVAVGCESAEGAPERHYDDVLEAGRIPAAAEQSHLLRDIFGPLPLRPVTLPPAWLTSTAVAIAAGVYQDKAFDRLPILADALQDAGCEDANVLDHLRGDGPHVRGCWALDLVLGKG